MADSSTLENASEEKKVERLSSPIRIDSRNEVINEVVSTRVQGVSVGTERPQITEPFLPSQLIINEDETAIFYHPDRPWYNSPSYSDSLRQLVIPAHTAHLLQVCDTVNRPWRTRIREAKESDDVPALIPLDDVPALKLFELAFQPNWSCSLFLCFPKMPFLRIPLYTIIVSFVSMSRLVLQKMRVIQN
jgi:hypothetical protein